MSPDKTSRLWAKAGSTQEVAKTHGGRPAATAIRDEDYVDYNLNCFENSSALACLNYFFKSRNVNYVNFITTDNSKLNP